MPTAHHAAKKLRRGCLLRKLVDLGRAGALRGAEPIVQADILRREHGGCGICKRSGLVLCVDHCHSTNKVRATRGCDLLRRSQFGAAGDRRPVPGSRYAPCGLAHPGGDLTLRAVKRGTRASRLLKNAHLVFAHDGGNWLAFRETVVERA